MHQEIQPNEMLIKVDILNRIKAGEVSLQFRRWDRPRVKKGSLIKTAIGIIQILDIEEINDKEISQSEANDAGYQNVNSLITELNRRKGKSIYKITLNYYGEDPRIALRNQEILTNSEFSEIKEQLKRYDQYSKSGSWTLAILNGIKNNPELKAQLLADQLNMDKAALKLNVRKLKNLGLTISHGIGYSLSARGKSFLKKMNSI